MTGNGNTKTGCKNNEEISIQESSADLRMEYLLCEQKARPDPAPRAPRVSSSDRRTINNRRLTIEAINNNEKVMRWFWAGVFVSIPVSFFIVGSDRYTTRLVSQFSLIYLLIPVAAISIYKLLKGIKPETPIFENSRALIYLTNSTMFVCGHGVGFAVIGGLRNIH